MGLFDIFKKNNNSANNVNMSFEVIDNSQNIALESKRLNENCFRSKNGLTVGEILLLDYCKRGDYPNPKGGYQNFWWFDYGFDNVGAVLSSLAQRGFIRFATPVERIETLKVAQLKEILSKLNLPASGKKDELISRIKECPNTSILNGYFQDNKYTLTELGQQELNENEYVGYIHSHKNFGISVWELNQIIYQRHLRYRDVIWGQFNKQKYGLHLPQDVGRYRNICFNMAEFLFEEERYADALRMYSEVCYYDVTYFQSFSGYDSIADLFAPAVIKKMKQCQEKTKISNNDLFKQLQLFFSKLNTYGRTINISNQDLAGNIVMCLENL
ncbi:MAG: hypothetical protein E7571_00460 [Ruminococcaceae bacterium]|nr:hypothetical protein [Oscillospiraceae bacterium]